MVLKTMSYTLTVYGLSDIGLVRQRNEDVWAELPKEKIYVLADGMGGHPAGDVASTETVSYFCELMRKLLSEQNTNEVGLQEMGFAIKSGIEFVNQMIYEMGKKDENLRGMGTTLCCLHFHPKGLIYAHVGDSRIYRLRKGEFVQLTKDHSLLRELVDLGHLSEREAKDYLYKNIITKAVGTEPFVTPSVNSTEITAKDIYLMCTDGLSDLLSRDEIKEVLDHNDDIKCMAEALIQRAKDRGGPDNITVVLIEVKEDGKKDLPR